MRGFDQGRVYGNDTASCGKSSGAGYITGPPALRSGGGGARDIFVGTPALGSEARESPGDITGPPALRSGNPERRAQTSFTKEDTRNHDKSPRTTQPRGCRALHGL